MELRVYIANLGKYNGGKLIGDWFTLPVDFNRVKEKIGLNDEYEEYAIHDYELPFKIGEYESLDRLNDIADLFEQHADNELLSYTKEIMDEGWFSSIDDLFERIEEITIYHDCTSMEDVAEWYVEECGLLNGASEDLKRYFDFKEYGRDMELQGNYLQIADFMIQLR